MNVYSALRLIIGISLFGLLFSCGQSDNANHNKQHTRLNSDLTIDTFSTFPPEIEGCSCYFSNDSTEFRKKKYIYMNNFAQTSFLKINGVPVKFTQTDFKKMDQTKTIIKGKSEDYELILEVRNVIRNGDETWLHTGTIKLTDKNGTTITKTFYGECGC